MNKKFAPVFVAIGLVAIAVIAAGWYLHGTHIALLDPAGLIAQKERDLLVLVTALCMVIVVPVFVLTVFVAWKYREGNARAKHSPDWDYKPGVDVMWWTVPTIIIIVISAVIWTSSRELDPYKPIASGQKPLIVEVVAMDWKWLFIYPEQGIATVNLLRFPEDTPVEFEITSDGPMNSFWIPELGSQIYAMPSMSTQLHLIAEATGTYPGVSANLSGTGFAGMTFDAQSVGPGDFDAWVQSVKASSDPLTVEAYNALAQPSTDVPAAVYSSVDPNLYNEVMAKDMMQASAVATDTQSMPDMPGMSGMDMQQ